MELPSTVTKYLNKYGNNKRAAEWIPFNNLNNIIVIPAIKEFKNLPEVILSLSENDPAHFSDTLVLFVINNAESASRDIISDNKLSLELLRKLAYKTGSDDFTKKVVKSGLNIALVDASSAGLAMPDKEAGVGLARKIGMDAALKLFDYSSLCKKILICLDADCTVDNNYVNEIVNAYSNNNVFAAVTDYAHDISGNDTSAAAIICYEIFLRYYVLGLHYAGSAYAYESIGSCMTCDYEHYIKIEGMNKKKAAEDFYFLEKLAKLLIKPDSGYTGGIHTICGTTVFPSARGSWRVPFGTGQRVSRFIAGEHNEYVLYDPICFEILKNWLKLFDSAGSNSGADEILSGAKDIHPELYKFLVEHNFKNDWEHITGNSKSISQLAKQKVIWFDGFRTMKLVHHLRDTTDSEINMFDALDKLFALMGINPLRTNEYGTPCIDKQKEYLTFLRETERKLYI
jgi:hypothetical protein